MVSLTIDGRRVEIPKGTNLVEAARAAGIDVPTLCYHRDLTPVGSCRICAVQIEGRHGTCMACTEPAVDGLVVQTESATIAAERKFILEMLLVDYHEADADDGRAITEFRRWVAHYGARPPEQAQPPRYLIDSDPHPLIRVDLNRCILCTRCVRACEEIQGRFVWGVGGRGNDAKIIAGLDTTMLDARCESCGACVAYCPTGALDDRVALGLGEPVRRVRTTCGYCGVGCQFDLNVQGDRLVRVTSHESASVNGMSLCVKGRYGVDFLHHPERLTRPRVRQYLLDGDRYCGRPADRGPWVEVDWDDAIALVSEKLVQIKLESGPDAIGTLASAKCTNEENYLVQKLARQVIGTHNVDHCARLCHASTVAGLAMAVGSGAMTNSMDDVAEHACAAFIIGSNTTEQHPVFGALLRQAVLRRGMKLVVADPRRIDITEFADLHLRQRPGTDVALINGIMYLALQNGWHDAPFVAARCTGFEGLQKSLESYDPSTVNQITGVPAADLETAAELLCTSRPMAVIWAMGITQHTTGVSNVLALANLQLLLGNLGVPGGGLNPLRGQNNVQGACDMGALAGVFPGYQSVGDAGVRGRFHAAWRLDEAEDWGVGHSQSLFGEKPGLTVTEMIDACGSGAVRGLYILGEDPVMTDPDVNHVKDCLGKAEFVVLQEIFPSETSRFADMLLPGAAFAEKSGTFTNTDRRIQPVRKAIPPPGGAMPDWEIVCRLAQTILARQQRQPAGPWAGWDYASPAEVLREVAAVTPSYRGVVWDRVDRGERLQWPVPAADHPGTPILHVDAFPCGRGRFHVVHYTPEREKPDAEYPLVLTTGRVLYHWHGGELSRRTTGLPILYPEPIVEVAPDDAARLGLSDRQPVRVRSRRGSMIAQLACTDRVAPGVVFANFHFPEEGNVNNLTIAALDPIAKIPEYKVCAVVLEALENS